MEKYFKLILIIVLPLFLTTCSIFKRTTQKRDNLSFYIVGHRGTRGLMPENTIPAFKKGIEVGANTIEFDVYITKDHRGVIYHDNNFDPAYTTMPDGSDIPKNERKEYTFYQMNYADIRKFIIGEKPYQAFPEQQQIKTYAPLLTEMIDSIETFTHVKHYKPVVYLLEIKSSPSTDGIAQPGPEKFVKLLMNVLNPYLKELKGRLIIQSFDKRPLRILHKDYSDIPLGLLVGLEYAKTGKSIPVKQTIHSSGFVPSFCNPYFPMVTLNYLKECHDQGIKVLPWTVQDKDKMKKLIEMGVDGIITDYPDRLASVVNNTQ